MKEKSQYFVLKEKAVPEVLLKVVEAKRLLESGRASSVQEATDMVEISRSSFYKYKADIYLKDKKVLTIDNDNIYSKNAAAYFETIQSNNVYIFNSFVARQCNSSKIMIMTSDGKKLEINESALDFDISKDLKSFTLTTCDSCMSDNCQIENYKIEKRNIVKSK